MVIYKFRSVGLDLIKNLAGSEPKNLAGSKSSQAQVVIGRKGGREILAFYLYDTYLQHCKKPIYRGSSFWVLLFHSTLFNVMPSLLSEDFLKHSYALRSILISAVVTAGPVKFKGVPPWGDGPDEGFHWARSAGEIFSIIPYLCLRSWMDSLFS